MTEEMDLEENIDSSVVEELVGSGTTRNSLPEGKAIGMSKGGAEIPANIVFEEMLETVDHVNIMQFDMGKAR